MLQLALTPIVQHSRIPRLQTIYRFQNQYIQSSQTYSLLPRLGTDSWVNVKKPNFFICIRESVLIWPQLASDALWLTTIVEQTELARFDPADAQVFPC